MITVRHLSKVYDNQGQPLTVLRDVNCEISRGEIISVIGPSGTGKSTFLRCLNCLETPTSGEIFVDGVNVLDKKTDLSRVRRKMGMVFQNFNLFNHLTVLENVCIGPMKLLGMSENDAREQAMELLRSVGLSQKAGSRPADLSGGQKQRAAIARCLSMKPDIILMDEPTSALDPTMVGEVLSVIRQLAKSGLTMVIVTHEMQFARDISSRIFFMYDGIIYEENTPDVIFEKPLKPATTVFVNKIRGIEADFLDGEGDLVAFDSSIDNFCMKYSVSTEMVERTKWVIGKMISEVLPHKGKVTVNVFYSEKKDRIYIQFYKWNSTEPLLADSGTVESFERIISPICLSVYDTPDGANRYLRLKLRRPDEDKDPVVK